MGKSSPAAPAAPDYAGAATAQGEANIAAAKESAKLSNPNIISPYGNQLVSYDASGQPTVTQSLTPQAQETLNAQQKVQTSLANLGQQGVQTAQNVMGTPFAFGGPQVQTALDTSQIAKMPVNAVTNVMQAIMSRL
jgi:hypothetical protein